MANEIDLDMLAYDLADLIDRNEYPLDVSADDIRPALPEFLARITQNAQARR
ncbi:hypothetical protein ACIBJI_40210 [Nocardia sp. NPDC050408]|uniref:hypothetical protein n=1 Tax=Nocardia sp. NPDC050408 TaxID=3364319 RepID=UPI0037B41888